MSAPAFVGISLVIGINGMQVAFGDFKRETDTVLRLATEKAKAANPSR